MVWELVKNNFKMIYECAFDFTICKPKKSEFIGKSGVIELTVDKAISNNDLTDLKTDKSFLKLVAYHLNTALKQKNIFMITVKEIKLKKK